MSDVQPRDILLRVGGGTLARYGTPVWRRALPTRGGEETKETFTRATVKRPFRDRDGIGRKAGAGNLAIDWPTGLVDAAGNPMGGIKSDGARTQLVTDPENFGAWTMDGGMTRTGGQIDPFGGSGAYLLDANTGAADALHQVTTFTGNATKAQALYMKAGTAAASRIGIFSGAVFRHLVNVTWTAGVPALSTNTGTGTLFPVEATGGGWYSLPINVNSVVAADTNSFYVYVDTSGANGTVYVFGANAWNSPFPSSYQGAGESAGVADSLTVPFNWGPMDLTVLIRLARPLHADASGALGVSPGIFSLGAGAAARIGCYFDPAARNIISVIDTATTDATQTTAIPAGQPTICVQYKNLTTGGQTAIDTGSGFTALSSAATGFSAFSSQVLRVARYDDELYGVLGDLIVARGLYSRAEMAAIP